MSRILFFSMLAAVAAGSPVALAQEAPRRPNIDRLVEQLGDPEFAVRRAAVTQLREIGLPALPAVSAVITDGDREAALRGVAVLQDWAQNPPQTLYSAAANALRELTSSPNLEIVRRAERALEQHYDYLRDITRRLLVEQNAQVSINDRGTSVVVSVSLPESWTGGDDLHELRNLQPLYSLSLSCSQLTDEALTHLVDMPRLQNISLYDGQFTPAGLRPLHDLPLLRNLTLHDLPAGGEILDGVAGCSNLEVLYINNLQGTDAALHVLGQLGRLRHLNMVACPPLGAGLRHVTACPSLIWLNIQSTTIDDAGFAALGQVRGLANLQLRETPVTEEALTALAQARITQLTFHHTGLRDEWLRHLTSMEGLERLTVAEPELTDDAIAVLERLPTIKGLSIRETAITPDGIQRLKATLQNCSISYQESQPRR